MTEMTPEQEALYALNRDLPRTGTSRAAQHEYDQLKPAWERKHPPGARGQRGSWLVTGPGRYARPVTGGQVRDTIFSTGSEGYDVQQVDALLRLVAEELDASRAAEPLISNAAFQIRRGGYDIDAVDWFLGQLLFLPDPAGPAEPSADPWRDLGVAATFRRSEVGDLADGSAGPSRRALEKYFSEECDRAWRDFDQQPGTYLRWATARRELRTMHEEQTIASVGGYRRFVTVRSGHKRFTVRKINPARSSSPGLAEIVAHSIRDIDGHFNAHGWYSQWAQAARRRKLSPAQLWGDYQFRQGLCWKALADRAGTPILYTSSRKGYTGGTNARISFPDQRWLRFLTRGTGTSKAVMTAVDEGGNSVVRYRYKLIPLTLRQNSVEITVHPDWELTEERVLAIAISALWLVPPLTTG
jgi:DivIVA domain-containing protein